PFFASSSSRSQPGSWRHLSLNALSIVFRHITTRNYDPFTNHNLNLALFQI
ncbi:hypothetical protein ACHAXS_001851, partial [Conticribra weissflogii]